MAYGLKLDFEKCLDGVEAYDYEAPIEGYIDEAGEAATPPSGLAALAYDRGIVGYEPKERRYRYRSDRVAPDSRTMRDTTDLVVRRFINADTERKMENFLSEFGFPRPQEIWPHFLLERLRQVLIGLVRRIE